MADTVSSRLESSTGMHESFLAHRGFIYLKVALFICVLAIAIYFLSDPEPRPNGGTVVGYTLGTIGALLILWLSLLGLRKRIISPGKWNLRGWTSAHVYLGLSLIVIGTLHTGFQFGWNVHTLAYALMMVVIFTGALGIWFYSTLPEKMSANRGEMSQVDMLEEISSLDSALRDAAQPLNRDDTEFVMKAVTHSRLGGNIFQRFSVEPASCATAKALGHFRTRLIGIETDDRDNLSGVVSVLERKNAMLIRARQHIRYKAMLETWLAIHIPFTFGLIAALGAHIFSVFYYW